MDESPSSQDFLLECATGFLFKCISAKHIHLQVNNVLVYTYGTMVRLVFSPTT